MLPLRERNVRIDEKECSNSQTLAVTVWPRAWLKPGEEAEVFIAMRAIVSSRLRPVNSRWLSLPSLISPRDCRPSYRYCTVLVLPPLVMLL